MADVAMVAADGQEVEFLSQYSILKAEYTMLSPMIYALAYDRSEEI